jgi:hypothetical protein
MSDYFSKQTEPQNEPVTFTVESIFLTPKELASRTGLSVQTLANERHAGKGFPYIKRGKSVLYFWPEIFGILHGSRIEPRRM